MSNVKTVLFFYDGSQAARGALRLGAQFAVALAAEAHLVSVVDLAASIADCGGMLSDLAVSAIEETTRRVLDEGIVLLSQQGVSATGHLAFGCVEQELVRLASAVHADLVVTSPQGRTRRSRKWGRSANVQLLDRLSCNVLVAHSF
jgi:nucleotide-binding universal stress UspA family protein